MTRRESVCLIPHVSVMAFCLINVPVLICLYRALIHSLNSLFNLKLRTYLMYAGAEDVLCVSCLNAEGV